MLIKVADMLAIVPKALSERTMVVPPAEAGDTAVAA